MSECVICVSIEKRAFRLLEYIGEQIYEQDRVRDVHLADITEENLQRHAAAITYSTFYDIEPLTEVPS